MKSWVKSVFVVSCAVVLTVSSGLSGVARPGDGDTQLQVQIDELTAKIKANPRDTTSLYQRAKLYRKLKMLDLAKMDAEAIVTLVPEHSSGYWLLAMVAKDSSNDLQGLSAIRKCMSREKDLVPDHVHFEMDCLRGLKRYQELMKVSLNLEKAVPNDAENFYFRAYARNGLGQSNKLVKADLDRARELCVASKDTILLGDVDNALSKLK